MGMGEMGHEMDLSIHLSLALHTPVDVHVLNGAPIGFQHAVFQGEPILIHDEERLTDFIEQVSWQAMEYAYLARVYLREVLS